MSYVCLQGPVRANAICRQTRFYHLPDEGRQQLGVDVSRIQRPGDESDQKSHEHGHEGPYQRVPQIRQPVYHVPLAEKNRD